MRAIIIVLSIFSILGSISYEQMYRENALLNKANTRLTSLYNQDSVIIEDLQYQVVSCRQLLTIQ